MASTSPKRSTTWFTLSLVGVSAAFAGWATALLALTFVLLMPFFKGIAAYPPGVVVFSLAAALASLLVGPLFWWLLIMRPRQLTLSRGIFVGSLGSLVAHPLTWFLVLVVASLGGNTILFLKVEHVAPIEILLAIPIYSVYSLFYVGWLTTLVGGVVGGILAKGIAYLSRDG